MKLGQSWSGIDAVKVYDIPDIPPFLHHCASTVREWKIRDCKAFQIFLCHYTTFRLHLFGPKYPGVFANSVHIKNRLQNGKWIISNNRSTAFLWQQKLRMCCKHPRLQTGQFYNQTIANGGAKGQHLLHFSEIHLILMNFCWFHFKLCTIIL